MLRQDPRFSPVLKRTAHVAGSTTDIEGMLLFSLAARTGVPGAVVEIGSFLGRSTIFLAYGSKRERKAKVFAIDPHRGARVINRRFSGPTHQQFLRNISKAHVKDIVIPIKKTSRVAIKGWQWPIRLLFIDGDHSYQAVRHDLKQWGEFVTPHGVIALHDVLNPGVGPPRAVVREMLTKKNYSDFGVVGSVFFGVKAKPKTLSQWLNWYGFALTMRLVEKTVSLRLRRGLKQLLIKHWFRYVLNWVTKSYGYPLL